MTNIVALATRSSELVFSLHTLTSTTILYSRHVLSLLSIVRIIINELQSLEKNRKFYLKKLPIRNNKNSELITTTRLQKNVVFLFISSNSLRACIDFSRDQLKPNDSNGTGDEGAAVQQYYVV